MKFPSRSCRLVACLFVILPRTMVHAEGNPQAVKSYLLEEATKIKRAASEFVTTAAVYQAVIEKHKGDYSAAYRAAGPELQKWVSAMRENYKAMDSFGYEKIEGIVAGVSSLVDYDVYLDSGVAKADASADSPAAPIQLKLSNGKTLDGPGALFTFVIEPMLWNANPDYIVPVDLNGDGKIEDREALPKIEILTAVAADAAAKIDQLVQASQAWQPSNKDCFEAVITMTPTLAGYFEDWKESRYAGKGSGLFSAVSRVSDMRGIMSSVQILYQAVDPLVKEKDASLSRSISTGFKDVMSFVEKVDQREKDSANPITIAEIDEMAKQATEKADKIVPQVEQASALVAQ